LGGGAGDSIVPGSLALFGAGDVHELGRDGATIYGAGFGGVLPLVEVGLRFGLELTERVKVGLQIFPIYGKHRRPAPDLQPWVE